MKYIVLIGDGMADRPLKQLHNRTCLQAADTPNMDWLAAHGEVGVARTIPKGFEPGSDVANLSILGYNPGKFYSGRAPLEAAYRSIELGALDVAFRCNLVTLSDLLSHNEKGAIMEDYSAHHITTNESNTLIRAINSTMGSKDISFYPGVSYRHLMVWRKGEDKVKCTPPHDITGKRVRSYLPKGQRSDVLNQLMKRSGDILLSHPVNKRRMQRGLRPANSIWLWGQGRKLKLPDFRTKYGIRGALISAVDLTKGLGICAGFDVINVKGATGYIDTNYLGKARAALKALKKYDIVYVHVEAPDEAGHHGDIKAKIQAIEDFDSKIVGTILKGVKKIRSYKILLMPDHATPIKMKTHTEESVPFVIFEDRDNGDGKGPHAKHYSENIRKMKNIRSFDKGHALMDYFLRHTRN